MAGSSAWFKALELDVDIITDEDLHEEGLGLLSDYSVVITGNHPEYISSRHVGRRSKPSSTAAGG